MDQKLTRTENHISLTLNQLQLQVHILRLWITEIIIIDWVHQSILVYCRTNSHLFFLLHTFFLPFPCHLHNFEQFLSASHKTESACHESSERFSQYCSSDIIWCSFALFVIPPPIFELIFVRNNIEDNFWLNYFVCRKGFLGGYYYLEKMSNVSCTWLEKIFGDNFVVYPVKNHWELQIDNFSVVPVNQNYTFIRLDFSSISLDLLQFKHIQLTKECWKLFIMSWWRDMRTWKGTKSNQPISDSSDVFCVQGA